VTCDGRELASGPCESEPKLRVVDVIRRVTSQLLREDSLGPEQRRLLSSIRDCRTPALGGEVLVCPECGLEKEVFHSCRNRHCPNCQAETQNKWIAARSEAMLKVPHFHVVFTLPAQLRALCKAHPSAMYDLLLRSCGDVLITLGRDILGAQLGVTVVLHTWTRDLSYHVHAHCIVSAEGWDADAAELKKLKNGRFLFPQARMKALFRARMLRGLRGLVQQGVVTLPEGLLFSVFEKSLPSKKRWVVHAEAPFGRYEHVLAYLGRYTHRVGISDSRLRVVSDSDVTFATRDGKTCTLSHIEFARRFLQHVLPAGLKKIRHYGLYAGSSKQRALALAAVSPRSAPTMSQTDQADNDPVIAMRPVWRERCCPQCEVPLLVAAHFMRPSLPPRWPP
jgi:hypothetical protein